MILGHARILERLRRSMRSDTLHHAYLFEGPSGVGKRTVATWLAQACNCERPDPPCLRCPTCTQIAAGTHPDVLTLEPPADRASQTIPIDHVREVIRKTGYHRYGGKRRFVIVDPAEAMLPSAANALLKTLEEPPPGTGFVLIASNASVLLPTIVSRCQRTRFGAVPEEEIVSWLTGLGHLEGAAAAARLAQGCPGRALALVEGGLEERRVLREELLAATAGSLETVYSWSNRICTGKRATWLARVEAVFEVLEDLLRDAAVLGSGSEIALVNDDLPEVVDRWSRALWPGGVAACSQALYEAREDLKVNVAGKTLLDALLVRVRAELRG